MKDSSSLTAVLLTLTIIAIARGQAVRPILVELNSPEASQQLLVTSQSNEDQTRTATYQSLNTKVAIVNKAGRVFPIGEGETEIVVQQGGKETRVKVTVGGLQSPEPVSFRREVLPILSKAGCNAGGCHGKAGGQNGFQLSIFGFDAVADHDALVKQGRGRRVFVASPHQSLLLQKATAEIPHGGGARLAKTDIGYRRIARWITEGARLDDPQHVEKAKLEIKPTRVVLAPHASQQIQVTVVDSMGSRRCITHEADFESNAETIAGVNKQGLITVGDIPGEAAILIRHGSNVAVCRVTLPQAGKDFAQPPVNNFIDQAIWNKLKDLGIQPSPLADDATFLRRVYLDTIGTLPTADEAREFLTDKSPNKRERLIEALLNRPEYADYWAMKWADVLRVDKSIVSPAGAVAMTRWLHKSFEENKPYDQFVRELVTARGDTLAEGPGAFYLVHKDPEMLGRAVSQVFLGVRIECAQCHHHPYERWSQQDYYAFAGFFTGVNRKKSKTRSTKLLLKAGVDLKHPRSGEPVPVTALGEAPVDLEGIADRRVPLADWMTSPENPFLARMIANRIWAHYFGRGLVEPIDDMRITNPAVNEPLLNQLAADLVAKKYDVKAFTKTVLMSRAYQLQSIPTDSNAADEQNFSHAAWKTVPAEVLLDAICQATGISEEFNGWPAGYRAIQVWDNRMPSHFFRVFGRPQRVSVCECERGDQPSIAQALALMNSPETVRKIRHRDGMAAKLAASKQSAEAIIEELYLTTLSRFPNSKEQTLMQRAFAESGDNRRAAVEDILWALLNTKEFIYNH